MVIVLLILSVCRPKVAYNDLGAADGGVFNGTSVLPAKKIIYYISLSDSLSPPLTAEPCCASYLFIISLYVSHIKNNGTPTSA